jgi:dimethylargininase
VIGLRALTRPVPASLAACELTHVARAPIDVPRAAAQHGAYERALEALGCAVERLPATPDLPDSVFVEDTAVVLDEVAILTRPGAGSRRGETAGMAAALARYRPVARVGGEATLDGGDVLRLGRTLHVGVGGRTNAEGARQLAALAGPYGYTVRTCAVRGCLHLKTAATEAADGLVLINPDWLDRAGLDGVDAIDVDPSEPFAANVLRVGSTVLAAAGHPRTIRRLERAGLAVQAIDMSELAKAEGALTCCSLVFKE